MDFDVYKPPKAALHDSRVNSAAGNKYYVVSNKKFLLLYISTLGIYSVYWFYKNWSLYKKSTGESMLPVMRGIFSIFFAHSLFRKVDSSIQEKSIPYSWSPKMLATVYVISALVANFSDRLATKGIGSPITDFLGLILAFSAGWALYRAQGAINMACNDPHGAANADITPANIIWIILGVVLWALILIGIFATLE
jgi:hypothetical protein